MLSPPPTLLVVAGVLIEHGRVLVTQRKAGTHLAGMWEFPGGKLTPGEDPRAGLARELREELGIEVSVGAPVEVTFHAYPERSVLLLFFAVTRAESSPAPRALDVADMRWAGADELRTLAFPPADVEVLAEVTRKLS